MWVLRNNWTSFVVRLNVFFTVSCVQKYLTRLLRAWHTHPKAVKPLLHMLQILTNKITVNDFTQFGKWRKLTLYSWTSCSYGWNISESENFLSSEWISHKKCYQKQEDTFFQDMYQHSFTNFILFYDVNYTKILSIIRTIFRSYYRISFSCNQTQVGMIL